MKKWLLLLLAGTLFLSNGCLFNSSDSVSDEFQVEPAAKFSLKDETGATHTLDGYQGKVLIINFIGYTCGTCIYYAPKVEAFVKSFNNPNFIALGMEIWRADEAEVLNFMQEANITYHVLLNAHNYLKEVGLPTRNQFLIIDGKGNVVYKSDDPVETYYAGWTPEEMRPVVEAAIAAL